MKLFVFLAVLIIMPFSSAQGAESPYSSSELLVNLNISSSAEIIAKNEGYNIEQLNVNLTFLPKNDSQQRVISNSYSPDAIFTGESTLFSWDAPKGEVSFFLNSEIQTTDNFPRVKRKVNFPLENIGTYGEYVLPTEMVDSDDERIIKLASELAAGEDDEFVVVSKLASWSRNNINYNLSTLTANVSQKASWVLENREGVCDELTNLFIALNRALGIPARFISGVSYTDSPLFPEKWGLHGWAEVYFPDIGWVPFDVTYGQSGYVDVSHVKLKEGADITDNPTLYSVKYTRPSSGSGEGFELISRDLDVKADIISTGNILSPDISMSVFPQYDDVGFGSSNLIEIDVKNLRGYYVAEELIIARTQDLEIMEEKKSIILAPLEGRKEYFSVKVKDNLDSSFIYSFPILVYSSRNVSASASFSARADSHVYLSGSMLNVSEAKKPLNEKISVNCTPGKKEYYANETALINCSIKNIGNTFIPNLSVCLDECNNFGLGITRTMEIVFYKKLNAAGLHKTGIKAETSEISQEYYADVKAVDYPEISIANLSYPESVNYDDGFDVKFSLKKGISLPKNASIKFSRGKLDKEWKFDEFTNQDVVIQLRGKNLDEGSNLFLIELEYYDNLGRKYEKQQSLAISLDNVNFFQKIKLFFRNLLSST